MCFTCLRPATSLSEKAGWWARAFEDKAVPREKVEPTTDKPGGLLACGSCMCRGWLFYDIPTWHLSCGRRTQFWKDWGVIFVSGTLSRVVRISPGRNCQRLITACVTKSKKLCCQGKPVFQGSSFHTSRKGRRVNKTEGKTLMNQAGLGLREVEFGILLPSAAALVCEFFPRWLNRTRIAPHTAAWKFVPCNFCFLAKAELQRNEG